MEKTNEIATLEEEVIGIFPKRLYFGIISNGFIYRLKFAVKNNSLLPLRIRVLCLSPEHETNPIRLVTFPEKIAPGMSCAMMLELTAEVVRTSSFELRVTQDYNKLVFSRIIEANIVAVETFKHVKKSLQLQKRPIYRKNVEVVGPAPTVEQMSIHSISTSLSENVLMDDEEIEDLLSMPITKNMYWDPVDKCLRIDPELGRVCVSEDMGVEESISKTAYFRKLRLAELEEQGFLTYKVLERMRDVQNDKNATSVTDDVDAALAERSADNSDDDEEEDEYTMHSGSHSHTMSVTSLLNMKRDKIEKQRKQSVLLASSFAKSSKDDNMVNSMRTLNMIANRPKPIGSSQPA